ncbi:MAG: hypothetical protein M5U01_07495 [Ardenticatenaceae bacterium]|nr:hypothetical protein [Ardenticatenaceae bacterium]HBY96134.1 hypothetical protein [Chloroflexota bacterium]
MTTLQAVRRLGGATLVLMALASAVLPILAQSPMPAERPTPTPFDGVRSIHQTPVVPARQQQSEPNVLPGPKPDLPQIPCDPLNLVRTLTQPDLCGATFKDSQEGRVNKANIYNTDPPCADCHDANEAVYTLDVDQPTRFGAGLFDFSDNGPWGLFLLPESCRADQALAGTDNFNTGLRLLLPGRYYLVVDTWTLNGRFQLSTACPFAAPEVDLPALPTTGTTITGNNSSGQNRVAWYGTHPKIGGVCSTTTNQTAPEVVYTLDVRQTQQVGITLTIQAAANLNLFLLRSYANVDCMAMGAQSENIETISRVLDPGRYYVVVDGTAGATANFTLQATVGSTVTSQRVQPLPQPLACNTTVSGDTSEPGLLNNANHYSCLGYDMPEPEMAYRFTLPATTTVSLLMTPTADFDYVNIQRQVDLFLLGDTSANSCLTFSNNTKDRNYPPAADWIQRTLSPGTYYAVVDGSLSPYENRMPFELSLSCRAEGDSSLNADCARADLNGDGRVTAVDLQQIAAEWPTAAVDLSGDGHSNVIDLMWAARFWNQSCYTASN